MGHNFSQERHPFWKEYFIYEFNKSLTASATGTSLETIAVKMDTDSNFEFKKTTFSATNDRIKVKLKDDAIGRYLIKDAVDIKSIAGRNTLPMGLSNSHLPFHWPCPYVVSAGSNLTLEAADYSNATNALRMSFHGSKIRPGQPPWLGKYKQIPFIYSFTGGAITVTASTASTARIETDIDSHFLVQKITGIRTGAATVSVNEGARGCDWSNIALHIDNLVGNGSFPNILPSYRFVQRGSTIVFNITDTSGNSNIIDICLIGIKLCPM